MSSPAGFTRCVIRATACWIRNAGRSNVNMTIAGTFQLTERYSLQLRGESFNTTNRRCSEDQIHRTPTRDLASSQSRNKISRAWSRSRAASRFELADNGSKIQHAKPEIPVSFQVDLHHCLIPPHSFGENKPRNFLRHYDA